MVSIVKTCSRVSGFIFQSVEQQIIVLEFELSISISRNVCTWQFDEFSSFNSSKSEVYFDGIELMFSRNSLQVLMAVYRSFLYRFFVKRNNYPVALGNLTNFPSPIFQKQILTEGFFDGFHRIV